MTWLPQSGNPPPILILSERGGIFSGIGEFIRRAERVPGEAREE